MKLLESLASVCASGGARSGEAADEVDGLLPEVVAAPVTTEEVAAVVGLCAATKTTMLARGSGTKLDWGGSPESLGVVIDLSGLNGVVEHEPGDFVVSLRAGTTLAALDRELERAGQRLPIDEVVPNSSVGGVIATGLSGPSRYLHGAVRDLLIGLTVVRADGVVARSGSKVVKNVAGYDLAKLFTGSYGTLAIVTEAIFRLRPRPRAERYLSATFADEAELSAALSGILASQLAFAAVELARAEGGGPMTLGVLLEGHPDALERRMAGAAALLGKCAVSDTVPKEWGQLPGPVTLKIAVPLGFVPSLLGELSALETTLAIPLRIRGSAGVGILYVGLEPSTDQASFAELLQVLRSSVGSTGGSVVVLRAPASIKAGVDSWGPVAGLELMRRVKERFDPDRRLSPGRFVGGI
ncbi:MAG: glcE [Acidimicrobiaceae bacterium]|nr:glcE [Acidimicrobiaceae bacterium]